MEELKKRFFIFPLVEWELEQLDTPGWILDIGGGGEGVIGQLMGDKVVAIDYKKEELLEAEDGPLKILMDARDLLFLDDSFQTATAFFSLMYLKEKADQQKAFQEISRVLKPGGIFHLWELDLSEKPETEKELYLVHLIYLIDGSPKETGYGMPWPSNPRGINDYLEMAGEAGLKEQESVLNGNTFYIKLSKE